MSEHELEYACRAEPTGEAVSVTRQGGLYRLGGGGHDLAPVDAEAATELAARAFGNRACPRNGRVGHPVGLGLARVSAPLPSEAMPAEG